MPWLAMPAGFELHFSTASDFLAAQDFSAAQDLARVPDERSPMAQSATASPLDVFGDCILSGGSETAFATAARFATYLRCGSASDRHWSMTASNVVGLKGLRRHRVAPSLGASLRKSGPDVPGSQEA